MPTVRVKHLVEEKLLDVKLICKKRKGEKNKISLTGNVHNSGQQKYFVDVKTGKSFGEGTQVVGVFTNTSEKT